MPINTAIVTATPVFIVNVKDLSANAALVQAATPVYTVVVQDTEI